MWKSLFGNKSATPKAGGSGGPFSSPKGGKPAAPTFTLTTLKLKYARLEQYAVITAANRDEVVELIRLIAELVIWGDQNDPSFFDYFAECRAIAHITKLVSSDNCPHQVQGQIIQTISMLIQNTNSPIAVFYLLSNNYINDLITHPFKFDQHEDLLAAYISFLKALSLRFNSQTIHFFFNAKSGDFPLYVEALRLCRHRDPMVKNFVRTISLVVFQLARSEPALLAFVHAQTALPYFANVAWGLREQTLQLDWALSAAADPFLQLQHTVSDGNAAAAGAGASASAGVSGSRAVTVTPAATAAGAVNSSGNVNMLVLKRREAATRLGQAAATAVDSIEASTHLACTSVAVAGSAGAQPLATAATVAVAAAAAAAEVAAAAAATAASPAPASDANTSAAPVLASGEVIVASNADVRVTASGVSSITTGRMVQEFTTTLTTALAALPALSSQYLAPLPLAHSSSSGSNAAAISASGNSNSSGSGGGALLAIGCSMSSPQLQSSLEDLRDVLFYVNDVFNVGVPSLSACLADQLLAHWVLPCLAAGAAATTHCGHSNSRTSRPSSNHAGGYRVVTRSRSGSSNNTTRSRSGSARSSAEGGASAGAKGDTAAAVVAAGDSGQIGRAHV